MPCRTASSRSISTACTVHARISISHCAISRSQPSSADNGEQGNTSAEAYLGAVRNLLVGFKGGFELRGIPDHTESHVRDYSAGTCEHAAA